MVEVSVLPDAEMVAVQWAKSDTDIAAIVDGRVSTRLPTTGDITFPWLRVFTVAGATPNIEVPVTQAVLQWDAFAAGGGDLGVSPDLATASLLARTLAAKIKQFDGYQAEPVNRRVEFGGESAIIDGFTVAFGPVRQAEPDTGWARYRVDTTIRLRVG